jgi:oligopeptidase B
MAQNNTPSAPKIDKTLAKFDHERIDPYYWMNQRDSSDVLKYIKEENDYCANYFSKLEPLVEKIQNEIEQRIDPNEQKAPFWYNGKLFQARNEKGMEYEKIYTLKNNEATLFFDENERAKNQSFYDLADWELSPNNKFLAVAEDFKGRRKNTISIRKNKTGTYLEDRIEDSNGDIIWSNDNKTIYYIKKDPQTLREYQVFRHTIGTDNSEDILVYQEDDEKYSVYFSKSKTGAFIFINCYSSLTSEVRWLDANNPKSTPQIFLKRKQGHLYSVTHHGNGFYIVSNDDAPNNKILFARTVPKSISQCQVFQETSTDTYINGISSFEEFMVIQERTMGLNKIKIYPFESKETKYIAFDEETYYLGLAMNDDYKSKTLYYTYNSMTTPSSIYAYDMTNGKQTLWHQKEIKDPTFSSKNYTSKRIWARANDGTEIPVSLVYKKGIDLSKAPLLLYGYGSYGITIPDVFSATRLSLLDRGFVFAVAHIRGGKYMGEHWYENGKFMKKINTFTDFINAAEYLGHMGYCDPSRIYAQGGSAGGLLMGAISNMAPYLWKGVVSQVPFVDVLTTMLDETIPLTTSEYEEWGNPNDEAYYYYLLKYSPYDNIKKMEYPAMYITTGYHDSQVQYWEPLKYVAKMRAFKTDKQPFLFDCNMDAGHGGGSGISNERKEIAKVYAFILGMENKIK